MAQELEYGDRECEVKDENVTDLEKYLASQGINDSASEYCGKNEDL